MVTGFNDYPGNGSRAGILKRQKFNQQLPVCDIWTLQLENKIFFVTTGAALSSRCYLLPSD